MNDVNKKKKTIMFTIPYYDNKYKQMKNLKL